MVPMAVVVAAVAVVVVSVPSAATATVSMMQTTKAGACPHGFYRAASGDICCQQCEAGYYLISDCTAEQGHSSCQVCEDGYYTEYPNSSPKCMECKPCQLDEEEERQCSASTNRRCRCKPGYHKPGGEEFCKENSVPPVTSSTTGPPDSGGSNTAGIVVPVVLLLLIVAAAAAFIYKKKRGKFPWEKERGHSDQPDLTASPLLESNTQNQEAEPSTGQEVRDMDESQAAKLIRGKRPELKQWIGRDPTYLLEYLDRKELISRDKYNEAKDINVKVERANFLIDEFIGRDECLKLWRALESLQDEYPQLKEWISACASTMPHACETADSAATVVGPKLHPC